mmetsp:Transcript_57231/g.100201  ORF Transcript_57231/g.100201 Transcript_57231/m.100201 type:complete len:667 (+) Transcript_57231:110-2110(+)
MVVPLLSRTLAPAQAHRTAAFLAASQPAQSSSSASHAIKRHISRLACASAAGFAGYVVWDVQRLQWSDRHTWSTALKQYVVFGVLRIAGRWRLRHLLADAEEGELVQRRLLGELLRRHQSTRYGRDRGLIGVSVLEDFRRRHPITRYSDYEAYVVSAQEGEENVLAPGRPELMAMTSGTSGSPKLLPHIADVSKTFFMRGIMVAFAVLSEGFPGAVDDLQRSMKLTFQTSSQVLPSGIKVGSNSSSPKDKNFQRLLCLYASPMAAYQVSREPEALYAHALFALKDRNLGIIEANFAPLVCLLLDTAREHRRSLVQDLRNGHIWDRKLPDGEQWMEVRHSIDDALGGPDARRALEVDKLLKARATAAEIWPNLRVVMTTDGGSFSLAAARLRELLGPSVEIYSPFYAATEGLLGVNIFPHRPFSASAYLLDAGSVVFELLPVQWRDCDAPPSDAAVLPWEAEIGQAYEMIITTRGGLCRYRLGDIVRVHARIGQMPVVTVEERATHFLPSLHGERVAEAVFVKALGDAGLAHCTRGAAVVDAPGKLPGARYHVFVEPAETFSSAATAGASAAADAKVSLDSAKGGHMLDEALCAEHAVYASFRKKGAISSVKLHIVSPGTFAALRPVLAARGGAELPPVSSGQVKLPTVLRGALAEHLLGAEVQSAG